MRPQIQSKCVRMCLCIWGHLLPCEQWSSNGLSWLGKSCQIFRTMPPSSSALTPLSSSETSQIPTCFYIILSYQCLLVSVVAGPVRSLACVQSNHFLLYLADYEKRLMITCSTKLKNVRG